MEIKKILMASLNLSSRMKHSINCWENRLAIWRRKINVLPYFSHASKFHMDPRIIYKNGSIKANLKERLWSFLHNCMQKNFKTWIKTKVKNPKNTQVNLPGESQKPGGKCVPGQVWPQMPFLPQSSVKSVRCSIWPLKQKCK